MACCGDTPTIETLAAVSILHNAFPDLKKFMNNRRITMEIKYNWFIFCKQHIKTYIIHSMWTIKHCTLGIGIWEWASNDGLEEPDIVMACCGDTPTIETLAAVSKH